MQTNTQVNDVIIKPNHILIVDDVPANLLYVSDVLSNLEVKISEVDNGKDALEIIGNDTPDLVLLDISMPLMDGYTVCTKLKANEKTKQIPVIFLTAKIDTEDIIKGFKVGAVDYIAKPFNTNELISRVRTHLELSEKRKQLEILNKDLEDKVQERTKELQNKNNQLQEANEKLSRLDKAKNEFILHVNHELRTPLQGVKGYSRLLEEYAQTEEQTEILKGLNNAADRLVKLSELSLLFAELRTDSYIVDELVTPVSEIMNEMVDKYAHNTKKVGFVPRIEPVNLTIGYDRKLIRTILDIVIDNALKYTVPDDEVILRAKDDESGYMIEVEDHGPGFTDKAISGLFDLFAADNLDHYSHGFGLGLSTAKLIADNIGGTIKIFNNQVGATVRVLLPKK